MSYNLCPNAFMTAWNQQILKQVVKSLHNNSKVCSRMCGSPYQVWSAVPAEPSPHSHTVTRVRMLLVCGDKQILNANFFRSLRCPNALGLFSDGPFSLFLQTSFLPGASSIQSGRYRLGVSSPCSLYFTAVSKLSWGSSATDFFLSLS